MALKGVANFKESRQPEKRLEIRLNADNARSTKVGEGSIVRVQTLDGQLQNGKLSILSVCVTEISQVGQKESVTITKIRPLYFPFHSSWLKLVLIISLLHVPFSRKFTTSLLYLLTNTQYYLIHNQISWIVSKLVPLNQDPNKSTIWFFCFLKSSFGSVAEHLPSTHEILGSVLSTQRGEKLIYFSYFLFS